MGFDKDYPNRKDWRKQYQKKAQQCDKTCRPGGDCSGCQGNRKHGDKKREPIEDIEDITEAKKNSPLMSKPCPECGKTAHGMSKDWVCDCGYQEPIKQCERCEGTGEVPSRALGYKECPECQGKKYEEKKPCDMTKTQCRLGEPVKLSPFVESISELGRCDICEGPGVNDTELGLLCDDCWEDISSRHPDTFAGQKEPIDLEESKETDHTCTWCNGSGKQMEFDEEWPCRPCYGTGRSDACPDCEGGGEVYGDNPAVGAAAFNNWKTCPQCKGKKFLHSDEDPIRESKTMLNEDKTIPHKCSYCGDDSQLVLTKDETYEGPAHVGTEYDSMWYCINPLCYEIDKPSDEDIDMMEKLQYYGIPEEEAEAMQADYPNYVPKDTPMGEEDDNPIMDEAKDLVWTSRGYEQPEEPPASAFPEGEVPEEKDCPKCGQLMYLIPDYIHGDWYRNYRCENSQCYAMEPVDELLKKSFMGKVKSALHLGEGKEAVDLYKDMPEEDSAWCDNCGKPMPDEPEYGYGPKVFCGRECQREWLRFYGPAGQCPEK